MCYDLDEGIFVPIPHQGDKMITFLKNRFRVLTPLEVVTRELAEASLQKLEAETAVDYAKSVVDYNNARINRLEAHLAQHIEEKK